MFYLHQWLGIKKSWLWLSPWDPEYLENRDQVGVTSMNPWKTSLRAKIVWRRSGIEMGSRRPRVINGCRGSGDWMTRWGCMIHRGSCPSGFHGIRFRGSFLVSSHTVVKEREMTQRKRVKRVNFKQSCQKQRIRQSFVTSQTPLFLWWRKTWS